MATETMEGALRAFFASILGGDPRIEYLVNNSFGRSRENWSFDLVWHQDSTEQRECLILRRDPTGGLVDTDRSREFSLLQGLEATPVPSPPVRWLDADGRWFGRPSLIMRREPGACDYYVLSGLLPLSDRRALAEAFCELLAVVHAVDWARTSLVDIAPDPGECAAEAELDRWEDILRRDQLEEHSEIDLAVRWLRRNPPLAAHRVLVHGDFKPGNVLLDGLRITALLDWELAHVGDPTEDLGWMTQPLRRREHLIPGHWEQPDILECYERRTGRTPDVAALRWWQMFATFRTAVMQVTGNRAFVEGRSTEPYRPTAKVLCTLRELAEAPA